MTELLLPYLPQLGFAGLVFVLLLGLAQLGLTQFCRSVLKKWSVELQGGAVLALSLALGALLGGVMLSRVAVALEIRVAEPWGGVVAGLVLAAVVSGLVSYQQQRSEEKARHQSDGLAAVLAQLTALQSGAPASIAAPELPAEALRSITPEEAASMTRTDWPALEFDDAPLADQPQLGRR